MLVHAGPSDAVDQLSSQIKDFERERDEATKSAETLAKTSVKLLEMIDLLDKLALEKVTEGDDDGARRILKEKEEVSLMLEKTKTRAENNYALAAKLAEAIGQKQTELVSLLPSTSRAEPSTPSLPLGAPTVPPVYESYKSTSTSSIPFEPPAFGSRLKPKWETSLEAARARIQADAQAANMDARWAVSNAEDSIAAALNRIDMQKQDIMIHRNRIRRTAEQSILEAKERLKKQEEEALDEIKWLMRRYSTGEYIPDYLLDSAFDKLSRRMYK